MVPTAEVPKSWPVTKLMLPATIPPATAAPEVIATWGSVYCDGLTKPREADVVSTTSVGGNSDTRQSKCSGDRKLTHNLPIIQGFRLRRLLSNRGYQAVNHRRLSVVRKTAGLETRDHRGREAATDPGCVACSHNASTRGTASANGWIPP